MSSNTLRGIGQEGEGEGGDGQKAGATDAGAQPTDATQAPTDPKAQPAATERMPELRKIRSLDSTVPGTRSLDSSVPEAPPSLDGKVPSLAATMMGMTAPSIPGRGDAPGRGGAARGRDADDRDKGTVQGRDVHLPVEMQRRAASIPIAGSGPAPSRPEPAPQAVDYSEPTIAEPVRVEHGTPELNSHGPWYDQEPVGADVYDDPKPSLIGRVAIGAAIAASLSVVLFAVVRVRAQGQAQEAEAALPLPAPPRPALVPAPTPPPTTGMEAAPTGAIPGEPAFPSDATNAANAAEAAGRGGLDPAAGGGVPPTAAARGMPGAPRPSSGTMQAPNRPGPAPAAYQPRPFSTAAKPAPIAPLPNNLFRPKALGEAPTEGSPTEPPATAVTPPPVAAVPATATPAPGAAPSPPAAASPPSTPAEAPAVEAPAAPRPASPSKPKAKYDPDSTLPLNLD